MNVRKPTDYSPLFTALDELVAANLPQMELCCGIGRLVSGRQEKGAAVAAAEYLHSAYPDAGGFSPRNLRRMRFAPPVSVWTTQAAGQHGCTRLSPEASVPLPE